MGKLLLFLSIVFLTLLSVGTTTAPDNSAFWLASGSMFYQAIRDVLGLVLIIQLLTTPPRQVWFRLLTGAASISTFVWVVYETYMFRMFALDGLAFMTAAIAIAIAALEQPMRIESIKSLMTSNTSKIRFYSS